MFASCTCKLWTRFKRAYFTPLAHNNFFSKVNFQYFTSVLSHVKSHIKSFIKLVLSSNDIYNIINRDINREIIFSGAHLLRLVKISLREANNSLNNKTTTATTTTTKPKSIYTKVAYIYIPSTAHSSTAAVAPAKYALSSSCIYTHTRRALTQTSEGLTLGRSRGGCGRELVRETRVSRCSSDRSSFGFLAAEL